MRSVSPVSNRPHGRREWRAWARSQRGLSPAAERLLDRLALHATEDGITHRSLSDLADDIGVSAGSYVGTLIKKLDERGIVMVQHDRFSRDRTNTYLLDPGTVWRDRAVKAAPINPYMRVAVKAKARQRAA